MSGTEHTQNRGFGRQLFIVLLLVGAVILLHAFAVPRNVDPTAMLALGFIILASYTIGELVGVIKLPHITGYLVAGLVFGPSVAHYLPDAIAIPPLREGILNESVIDSLSILDTLAVALIAMTAGGELKIDNLRKGIRAIASVLFAQLALVVLLVGALIWLVGGVIEPITLPGLEGIPQMGALGLGLVVASIAVATSPAATIAVINSAGAEGPMTRIILSTVVLKDVVVVMLFSLASVVASTFLGQSTSDQNLGTFFATHIGGSLVVGAGLGFLFSLYLRFVGREVLLVIVGVVYAATLLAKNLDLDPVLLFIAAGFTVSNFSREGDTLIHSVERLSMPVYVVFFTLAGAKLHLDELMLLLPYAAALVGTRLVALRFGVSLGAKLGGADENTRRYGWLGFVSQAGVAISLAAIVGRSFGDAGRSLETLIIAGVAIHELIGPVMLKVGLGLAKEIPSERGEEPAGVVELRHSLAPGELDEWPVPGEGDPWGPAPDTKSAKLNQATRELRGDLVTLVRDVSRGALQKHREDAEAYVRDLRREFLRHHRRLAVCARTAAEPSAVSELLHAEESALAERWRSIVLGRAARLGQKGWSPTALVDAIDRIVGSVPERFEAPWEDVSFETHAGDNPFRWLARAWLRARRAVARVFRRTIAPRDVQFRTLVRYHLGGVAPTELESLAALLVSADLHLAARTRSLFDGIVTGYDALAKKTDEPVEARLAQLRTSVEEELDLASTEIARIAKEGAARTAQILGRALRAITRDLDVFGTLDLPNRKRRSSRVFRDRIRAIDTLSQRLDAVRKTVAGVCSLLGLELELVGLEARVKDALDEHVSQLEADVRGRARLQAQRVEQALGETRAEIESALGDRDLTGEQLALALREQIESLEKTASEAGRTTVKLRDQLTDERTCLPLLDALRRASQTLGDRYDAPEGRLMRGEHRLPQPVPVMEVPFRELVTAHVEANVAPKLLATTRAMAQKVQPLVSSLAEVERLVAFNAELASSELDVIHEESVPEATRSLLSEILLGALERSREVMQSHLAEATRWDEELGEQIRSAVLGGVSDLRAQLVDGELTRDRLELLRRRTAGQRLIRRAETLPSLVARARQIATRTFLGLVGAERLESWRRSLGLPAPRGAELPDPALLARPEAASAIPLVYRRLFAAETVEAADVLTAREGTIDRARRVLSGKTPGRLRAVALVGLDGVGKGALSAAIVRGRGDRGVRRIRLDQPATLDAVEEWFKERQEGQLVVLTGFHWLVSMRAGGFGPLRRFIDGVIKDGGRNAWLVSADSLVWQVACQAAPIADAFPEVIRIEVLGPAELEAAVLARHGLSGYGLNFEPRAERSRLEEVFARGASRIRRPYDSYFRSLHAASGGLVRDALRLWLASIDEVNEAADFVHVGKVPVSAQIALRRLPENVLLQLYQVARQGWMDATVQAYVFRVDQLTAEAQLSRLAHLGLLEPRENGSYRIPPHLRGPVYRTLRDKGWVR